MIKLLFQTKRLINEMIVVLFMIEMFLQNIHKFLPLILGNVHNIFDAL